LRITLRRGDWWGNETNAPLYINPFQWKSDLETMNRMIEHGGAEFSPHVSVNPGNPWTRVTKSWGLAFAHLPNLQRLVIDFETSEDKKVELERIVDWAVRDWKFPLRSHAGNCLSPEGNVVKRESWRGMPTHWSPSRLCPGCSSHPLFSTPGAGLGATHSSDCIGAARLASRGLGPRMFTWTVVWTARRDATYEFSTRENGLELLDKNPLVDRWVEKNPITPVLVDNLLPNTCMQKGLAYGRTDHHWPLIF
jgi:hypothetical protein